MTLLSSTFLIYFLFGIGVAVAVYVSDMARSPAQRCFQTTACLVFWPLFLPLLLQKTQARGAAPSEMLPPDDELGRAIAQVDAELNEALQSMGRRDGHLILREAHRLGDLRARWHARAHRIREMDRLLASPEYVATNDAIQAERPVVRDGANGSEQFRGASNAMCAIFERLRQVREETHAVLMESLARVRQLAVLLHLARFTGEPTSHTLDLLREIEAEMEPTSERPEPIPCAADDTSSRE